MKIPVGGLYEFYKIVGDKRENWFIEKGGKRIVNDKTLEKFNEWVANPVDSRGNPLTGANWRPVSDWLPDDVAQQCLLGKCEIGTPSVFDKVFKKFFWEYATFCKEFVISFKSIESFIKRSRKV